MQLRTFYDVRLLTFRHDVHTTLFVPYSSLRSASMYRANQPTSSSIGRDFISFGHEALGVHCAEERRIAELQRNELKRTLRASRQTPWARRTLGTLMIALGTKLSGKAARMPEREATRPLPESRARLAPTR